MKSLFFLIIASIFLVPSSAYSRVCKEAFDLRLRKYAWKSWSVEDVRRLSGEPLRLSAGPGEEVVPQTVYPIEALPGYRRDLVREILKRSKKKKFRQGDYLARFEEDVRHFMDLIERKGYEVLLTEVDVRAKVAETLRLNPEVEIGVAIFEFGGHLEMIAFHTSSRKHEVKGKEIDKAVQGLLDVFSGRIPSSLKAFHYFHNHPSGVPISAKDHESAILEKRMFAHVLGKDVAVNVYAISILEGVPIVYHAEY